MLYDSEVAQNYRLVRLCFQIPVLLLFWGFTFTRFYMTHPHHNVQLSNMITAFLIGLGNIAISIVGTLVRACMFRWLVCIGCIHVLLVPISVPVVRVCV